MGMGMASQAGLASSVVSIRDGGVIQKEQSSQAVPDPPHHGISKGGCRKRNEIEGSKRSGAGPGKEYRDAAMLKMCINDKAV